MKSRIATALPTLLTLVVGAVAGADAARACTVFQIMEGNAAITGYNFDWFKPIGATAYVNPRGVEKVALAPGGDRPAQWTSRFGSVTFTGFGREFPVCGMNEAGLVVVQAWLGATQYPEIDERPSLSELQWIQYQLDTAETVTDVIASDSVVRISKHTLAPLHYFISDRSGTTAVIEFLDGKASISSGKRMPIKLMVNTPYRECLNEQADEPPLDAEDRFAVGARMLRERRPGSGLAEQGVFEILDALSRAGTRWAVAFNSATGEVFHRVAGAATFQKFDAKALKYECGETDLQLRLGDDPRRAGFTAYDPVADREQILASGATIPNSDPQLWEAMAEYSRLAGCK